MSFGGAPVISSSRLGWNAYMPALTRSETGWLGFSANPVTRPATSNSTTPPADGFGEWNTVRVATMPWCRCASTSDRRSKSVRLSALQARNELFTVHPPPVGGERARAA